MNMKASDPIKITRERGEWTDERDISQTLRCKSQLCQMLDRRIG